MNGNALKVFLTRRDRWLALVLAAAAFAVFANSLSGDFVYDDKRQIERNPLIQQPAHFGKALTSDVWAFKGDGTQTASNYWRPTYTAWSILSFQFFGLEPFGWHLLNVLLHTAITVFAFLLLCRFGAATETAFFISLIFAVHPVHSESVAWISGVPDLLFGILFLGTLWFAQNYALSGHKVDLLVAMILYLLALGAKEIAMAAFPILLFVFAGEGEKPLERREILKNLPKLLPFAFSALLFFLMRWIALGAVVRPAQGPVDPLSAIYTAPLTFLFYLKQSFWPYPMGANYPLRPVEAFSISGVLLPAVAVSAVLAALFLVGKRSHLSAIGGAMLLLLLLPVLNIGAFLPEQIVHDRYMYLPLLGLLIVIVPVTSYLFRRYAGDRGPVLLAIGWSGICVILAIACVSQNRVWRDELSLWSNAIKVDPGSATNYSQYGAALESGKRYGEALLAFNRSIDNRPNANAYVGRARTNLYLGKYEESVWDLQTVTELRSEEISAYTLFQAYEALALAYTSNKEHSEAVRALDTARKRLPIYNAALTSKLAVVYYQLGRKREAMDALERVRRKAATELLPQSKTALYRLGALYAEFGRNDDARTVLREYLRSTSSMADKKSLEDRKAAVEILRRLE